jgi:hypothetical protein
MLMNNSQNGNLVHHSQSAHQLGLQQLGPIPQQPHTPIASHHQMLQQQLQKHFQHNNMGKSPVLFIPKSRQRRSSKFHYRRIFAVASQEYHENTILFESVTRTTSINIVSDVSVLGNL